MNIIGVVSLEQELHRYVSFEKFMDLISTQKMFLSKISAFDDHLEGSFTPFMAFFLSGGGAGLNHAMANAPSADNSPESQAIRKKNIDGSKQELDSYDMSSIFKGYPYKDYGDQFEYIQLQHREWINAICWHGGSSESMAMWKIYGENDNAVCIISDVSSLKSSIKVPANTVVTLARIEYINHLEEEFKNFDALAPFTHKSYSYMFEQEYRVLAYNPNTKILNKREEADAGVLLDVDISCLIKEIRVSHKSPDWFFKMVERFSKKYISENILVTRSEMSKKAVFSS